MDFDDLMKKIDYLVRVNPAIIHPPLSQLGKTVLMPSYKPISKEKARRDLLKLGPEEIEKLYNEEILRQREEREIEEKKLFFHQSYYDADFNHYGKKALWSIDEGITLILGKDPRKVKWEDIKIYSHLSPLVKKFEEIKELASSYKNAGQLSDPITPGKFLAWIQRIGFNSPEKLLEVVNTLGVQIADWQTLYMHAIELLDEKDRAIQALQVINEKLESNYEELKKNPHQMDEESDNYAPELDAANITYRAIINNPNENLSFKKHADKVIKKLYPKFSGDAKKRIAMVINTIKGRKGGRGRNT